MSVLDSIDTTVTLEWPGRRTIGTLIEIDGYAAVITALNAPTDGASISVTVEGDTPDEAVSMDGICTSVSETAWGEQRIEMELTRVGTTCSASRLRDFVEQFGVASGGSVHIGNSRQQPSKRRFVYHVPERIAHQDAALTASGDVAIGPDLRATLANEQSLPLRSAPAVDISDALDERRRSLVQTARNLGRPVAPTARTGETLLSNSGAYNVGDVDEQVASALASYDRAASENSGSGFDDLLAEAGLVAGAQVGTDANADEIDVSDLPEKTINTDLAGGAFITGGSLDEAFREALRAVERPKLPEQEPEVSRRRSSLVQSSPEIAMDAVPVDSEFGRPVLPDDDLDATVMIQAMPDEPEPEPAEYEEEAGFTATDLSVDELDRLKAAIDVAVAQEREMADSAHYDTNEPIIVNTVDPAIPFADPVQLGHDNRAPTMAQVAPAASPAQDEELGSATDDTPNFVAETSRNRASTARIERVIPSLAGALTAPKRRKSDTADEENAEPRQRKASSSLNRIQSLFNVDMAIRCDIPVTFQIGKKKYQGQLVRLAESRLRVQSSEKQPQLYQRMKVILDSVQGGKHKITLQCEVTRIRETQESGVTAFDMRLSAGTNSPKEMAALRALRQSFEAPSSRPAEASA